MAVALSKNFFWKKSCDYDTFDWMNIRQKNIGTETWN
jgi:hypothetical protein